MDDWDKNESNARTYIRKFPAVFIKGEGSHLIDEQGNQYIDCLACAGALPLGHNHPVFKKALMEYTLSSLPQQMLDLATPAKREYIQEIKRWFPQEMNHYKYQFCSPSGSDAVEAALKLCRIASGRQNIISFSGGFHGQTLGALLCMGNKKVKNVMGLTNYNSHVIPYPNKYHWFDEAATEDEMIDQSLKMFEQLFTDDESGVCLPAGVILETIQGEGGVGVAPFRWVQGIRRICTEQNIPMICDEVQSGWMRTGKPFAFNWSEIIPDVVICSKAAGGGQPMAFIYYNPKLDVWLSGAHTGTFRGNQLAMVTGKAVLQHLRNSDFETRVAKTGLYLKNHLLELQVKFPDIIAEVRGIGLFLGIQIGNGHKYDGVMAKKIQTLLFQNYKIIIECGGREGSVIRFLTSLEIKEDEIDIVIEAMTAVMNMVKYFMCGITPPAKEFYTQPRL